MPGVTTSAASRVAVAAPFASQHGDAERGGFQHQPVVAPIADGDGSLRPQALDIRQLGRVLCAGRQDGEGATHAVQRRVRHAESVGGDDVYLHCSASSVQPRATPGSNTPSTASVPL